MADFGLGMTMGPNGPQLGPVLMLTSNGRSEPESYESHFETPEGVHIAVTYHTKNKTQADRYSDELAQKSGWKSIDKPEDKAPMSLASEIGMAWVFSIFIVIGIGFLTLCGAAASQMAGYIGFGDVDAILGMVARAGLWGIPFLGFLLTGVTLITHSSQNKHD